jgi:hypothetical protein
MLHTLLPGESVTLHIATGQVLNPADLIHPRVLRCANQLRSHAERPEAAMPRTGAVVTSP